MKRTLWVLALGVGLSTLMFCVGRGENKANADIPTFATPDAPINNTVAEPTPASPTELPTPPLKPAVAAVGDPAGAAPAKAAPGVAAPTNATNLARQPVAPESVNLTPALAEIVKLAQAGIGEDVLLAYITNSVQLYEIGPNEILYLHDLGVASSVITVLIQRDSSPEMQARRQAATAVKPLPPGIGLTTPATNVYPPKVVSQPPEPAPVNPPGEGNGAVNQSGPVLVQQPIAEPPVVAQEPVSVAYFQSELAPYGSWLDVPGYGSCWRPTVAVCNSAWRPYGDSGRWLWTDAGWYWYSDYSWGWAPFHYGRWTCPSGLGWVWVPDTCWGPSWVSWRYTSSHCGWAPLPPSAVFVSGHGFYCNTLSVGINFDFGLPDRHYLFLPFGHFCDRAPHHYYASQSHARTLFKDSTVINNYVVGNNNTIINHGAGFDRVAKVTHGDIRQVALRGTTAVRDLGPRRERLETDGRTLTLVRPTVTAPRISPPERPVSAISGLAHKVQMEPAAPAKNGGATSTSLTDVNSSAAVGKTPRWTTSSPMSTKGPGQASHSDNPIAKPQDTASAKVGGGGTAPPSAVIIKPTGPSLKPGNSAGARPVPSWMDNTPPSAAKPPLLKTPSSLASSESVPTVTQPAPVKPSVVRNSDPPPSRIIPPSLSPTPSATARIQTAPSGPAPVAPRAYTPAPVAPAAVPHSEAVHSHSAPHSAPPSVSRPESSSHSSSSRSSDSDSRKGSK